MIPHTVRYICHESSSVLDNNVKKCPSEGSTIVTNNVHYNMVANIEALASVLTSSDPIRRDQVDGNALRITSCTSVICTDNGDTQAKHWAAPQISDKRHVQCAPNSNIRK